MKLSPTGRNRLEAMKRALAAGLPLAGLLAAAACSKEPEGKNSTQPQRDWRYLGEVKLEECEPMGDLIPDEPEDNCSGIDQEPIPVSEPEWSGELEIATDVATLGILLPPDALQPPEGGGEAEGHADDDVVVRVEDASPAEDVQQ